MFHNLDIIVLCTGMTRLTSALLDVVQVMLWFRILVKPIGLGEINTDMHVDFAAIEEVLQKWFAWLLIDVLNVYFKSIFLQTYVFFLYELLHRHRKLRFYLVWHFSILCVVLANLQQKISLLVFLRVWWVDVLWNDSVECYSVILLVLKLRFVNWLISVF